MGKCSAKVDITKNRIYFTISGFLTVEEASMLKEEYRAAISKCKPGFTVLTNAIDFKPGSEEVQNVVMSCAELAANAGCKRVARVVGNSPLGGMQINRVASSVATYEAEHFRTMEEAEAYLDAD